MKKKGLPDYYKDIIELLELGLPEEDPCDGCNSFDCTECDDLSACEEYRDKLKPYEEAGVFKYALVIKKIKESEEIIAKAQKEIKELKKDFPDVLIEYFCSEHKSGNYRKLGKF